VTQTLLGTDRHVPASARSVTVNGLRNRLGPILGCAPTPTRPLSATTKETRLTRVYDEPEAGGEEVDEGRLNPTSDITPMSCARRDWATGTLLRTLSPADRVGFVDPLHRVVAGPDSIRNRAGFFPVLSGNRHGPSDRKQKPRNLL